MSKQQDYTFAAEAQAALDLMENTGKHLFLTGKAGTGKSTLLEYFRSITKKKGAILAPTGVAAVNVDGETIHAFFGLKPGFERAEAMKISKNPKNPSLYKRVEMIIIDEISMVRADILDAIDIFLRNARKNPDPFGGVQMVFIGDLYQLPPVITDQDKKNFYEEYGYKSPYFFESEVFQRDDFLLQYIELQKIYRQKDNAFITLLNAVRDNTVSFPQIQQLNKRVIPNFNPPREEGYISLCTTNRNASEINQKNLESLLGKDYLFDAKVAGKIEKNQFPAETELWIKEQAQIIFLNNDSERRWVNGSLGTIIAIDEQGEYLEVEVNGRVQKVEMHTWEISKYVVNDGELKREMLGSFTQYPLKLAWAITIHKSQGKTFSKVIIDLGWRAFAHGQTYVALSRCESFEGMVFKRPIRKNDIIMDQIVKNFLIPFDPSLAAKNFSLLQKKKIFSEAIENNKTLKITYLSSQNQKSIRRISPSSLEEMEYKDQKFWGITAYCYERYTEEKFSLGRILWVHEG